MKLYKVWLCVEEQNDDPKAEKEYQDVDLPFSAVAEFKSEDKAVLLASRLQIIGRAVVGDIDQVDHLLDEGGL